MVVMRWWHCQSWVGRRIRRQCCLILIPMLLVLLGCCGLGDFKVGNIVDLISVPTCTWISSLTCLLKVQAKIYNVKLVLLQQSFGGTIVKRLNTSSLVCVMDADNVWLCVKESCRNLLVLFLHKSAACRNVHSVNFGMLMCYGNIWQGHCDVCAVYLYDDCQLIVFILNEFSLCPLSIFAVDSLLV